eukprot:c20958_g1_i4.p1 GENE.c20958_g1_i4~~c20958_g1_i4.p1  ORF type:complete len:409 (-),score=171.35 c20958_g1_i4:193-1419(-)
MSLADDENARKEFKSQFPDLSDEKVTEALSKASSVKEAIVEQEKETDGKSGSGEEEEEEAEYDEDDEYSEGDDDEDEEDPNPKKRRHEDDDDDDDDDEEEDEEEDEDEDEDEYEDNSVPVRAPVRAPVRTPVIAPVVETLVRLPDAPNYWATVKVSDINKTTEHIVSPQSTEFSVIQKNILIDTIASYHIKNGLNHKVLFTTFEVTRIIRVQNPTLWSRYVEKRKKFAQMRLTPATNVIAPQPIDSAIQNEYWFVHGLNTTALPNICESGFDSNSSSSQGMFGAAFYFAENSSKSNQYSHGGNCFQKGAVPLGQHAGCQCQQDDEVCLLVCRVLLGEPWIENKFQGNKPGEFWHGRRTDPVINGITYNSVIAQSKSHSPSSTLMLREYALYETTQIYPEYKLYYKRKL